MNKQEYILSLVKKAAYGVNNQTALTILHSLAKQNHVSPTALEALHGAIVRQSFPLVKHMHEFHPEVVHAYQQLSLDGKVPTHFPIRPRTPRTPLSGMVDGHRDGVGMFGH